MGRESVNITINLSAWGPHVATMRSVLFPSLLWPGNLPALAARHRLTIDLCSTPDIFDQLADCPTFARIVELADVNFLEVDPRNQRPHITLTACHRHSLAQPCDGCMFLQPDMLFADGAFRWLAEVIPDANAVMLCTPRAILSNVLSVLSVPNVPMAPRQLIRLMLDHKHPVTDSLIMGGNKSSMHPSHLYWPANDGFVVRAFHLHPLFVVPRGNAIGNTIDGDYLQHAYPDADRFVYATNSDDIACIEISEPQHMGQTMVHKPFSTDYLHRWMRKYTLPLHHQHAQQKIRLVADDTDKESWQLADSRADEFADSLSRNR